jgi:hypothetical protein
MELHDFVTPAVAGKGLQSVMCRKLWLSWGHIGTFPHGAGASGRVSMQMVLKDALERAASGGSSSIGDAARDSKSRGSFEERRPRGSTDGGSCLANPGSR